ncbi:MAG: TonB-dependent receptor [Bacteroidota bacterium]
MKRLLLLAIIFLSCIVSTHAGDISGRIYNEFNEPFEGATVKIQGTQKGALTGPDGRFIIKNVSAGTYTLEASSLGYKAVIKEVAVSQSGTVTVDFSMETDATVLNEVVITEKSRAQELSEDPIQITSIDVVALQNETADIVAVLDRAPGVRVRQSGGLGSNTTIQLNGLTGRAVRTYYNGIPLELLGGGIQLNNLPVNTIERIDVYKGVMPIDVGTDALAGGINVVTRTVDHDFLDASYQVGSFNTHVGALNSAKKLGEHVVLSLSGFYNYSDNSYRIRAVQIANFKEDTVEVDRFHSAHQSSMIQGGIGLINVKWADKFAYSISYNQRYDEIQHGVRLGSKAVGEADVERDVLLQTLQFSKSLFQDKLGISYFGAYARGNEAIDDSTTNVYSWFGEVIRQNAQGVEVLGLPSLRTGEIETQVHRLNLSYNFSPTQTIKVSSFLSDQEIVGEDPIAPKVGGVDPNTFPSVLTRSITGLGYEAKWFNEKLETNLFGKYYYYEQSTTDFRPSGATEAFEYSQEDDDIGYGAALKFDIKDDFFIRTSYERAIRIPTKEEVFGNFLTIEPNFLLRPETGSNLNVGVYFKHNFTTDQYLSLDVNGFIRDQSNLIRLDPGRAETDPAQYINEAEVDAMGIEVALKGTPLKGVELSASFTYQEVVIDGEVNATNTNGIGNPIPNIPTTFFNVAAKYKFNNPISKKDRVTLYSYFNFVDEFDLIFQPNRNIQNIIPTQRQLDAGITYKLADTGLTFSLQVDNILNADVFDNFRVPRPGRNISFKIRYLFQKL